MNERCRKFEYDSEAAARKAMKTLKASSHENKKLLARLSVYLCHLHQAEVWHVGHNPFATARARRYQRRR
jgi:hypothetical protein